MEAFMTCEVASVLIYGTLFCLSVVFVIICVDIFITNRNRQRDIAEQQHGVFRRVTLEAQALNSTRLAKVEITLLKLAMAVKEVTRAMESIHATHAKINECTAMLTTQMSLVNKVVANHIDKQSNP
ncbi:hypothetical protein LPJ61_000261 [Coemansia biformis]|uniref:Uncharacterized protein n=1 Tax=Coemansia biformis TaxID=1286918 RepID=A0A9W8D1T2_9FUNG|nr:hypothetical protein LPJ61_000261 [Coemansia biformis]